MVRTATFDDLPRILEMATRFVAETNYQHILRAVDPELIEKLALGLLENPQAICLVNDANGGLTGMLAMIVLPHPMSGELVGSEIVWWADPELRGEGVRMLLEAERRAKALGAVVLQMIAPTRRVEMFYERMGYSPVERAYQKRVA